MCRWPMATVSRTGLGFGLIRMVGLRRDTGVTPYRRPLAQAAGAAVVRASNRNSCRSPPRLSRWRTTRPRRPRSVRRRPTWQRRPPSQHQPGPEPKRTPQAASQLRSGSGTPSSGEDPQPRWADYLVFTRADAELASSAVQATAQGRLVLPHLYLSWVPQAMGRYHGVRPPRGGVQGPGAGRRCRAAAGAAGCRAAGSRADR